MPDPDKPPRESRLRILIRGRGVRSLRLDDDDPVGNPRRQAMLPDGRELSVTRAVNDLPPETGPYYLFEAMAPEGAALLEVRSGDKALFENALARILPMFPGWEEALDVGPDDAEAKEIMGRIKSLPDGNRLPCRLMGDLVMVSPGKGGTVWIIGIPRDDPRRSAAWRRLDDIAADVHAERADGGRWRLVAQAPEDVAMRYLIRTGDLVPDDPEDGTANA